MKQSRLVIFAVAGWVVAGVAIWQLWPSRSAAQSAVQPVAAVAGGGDARRVEVVFTGGYETDPVDRGRPVRLIAGALGVTPQVFREAFSHVHPAPAGERPDDRRARENKDALMAALGPHGITNERLDEVSNYYRYRPGSSDRWPTRLAVAYAVIKNGAIMGFEIADGGSGYHSPPEVMVAGFEGIDAKAELAFGKDFKSNGAVAGIGLSGDVARGR